MVAATYRKRRLKRSHLCKNNERLTKFDHSEAHPSFKDRWIYLMIIILGMIRMGHSLAFSLWSQIGLTCTLGMTAYLWITDRSVIPKKIDCFPMARIPRLYDQKINQKIKIRKKRPLKRKRVTRKKRKQVQLELRLLMNWCAKNNKLMQKERSTNEEWPQLAKLTTILYGWLSNDYKESEKCERKYRKLKDSDNLLNVLMKILEDSSSYKMRSLVVKLIRRFISNKDKRCHMEPVEYFEKVGPLLIEILKKEINDEVQSQIAKTIEIILTECSYADDSDGNESIEEKEWPELRDLVKKYAVSSDTRKQRIALLITRYVCRFVDTSVVELTIYHILNKTIHLKIALSALNQLIRKKVEGLPLMDVIPVILEAVHKGIDKEEKEDRPSNTRICYNAMRKPFEALNILLSTVRLEPDIIEKNIDALIKICKKLIRIHRSAGKEMLENIIKSSRQGHFILPTHYIHEMIDCAFNEMAISVKEEWQTGYDSQSEWTMMWGHDFSFLNHGPEYLKCIVEFDKNEGDTQVIQIAKTYLSDENWKRKVAALCGLGHVCKIDGRECTEETQQSIVDIACDFVAHSHYRVALSAYKLLVVLITHSVAILSENQFAQILNAVCQIEKIPEEGASTFVYLLYMISSKCPENILASYYDSIRMQLKSIMKLANVEDNVKRARLHALKSIIAMRAVIGEDKFTNNWLEIFEMFVSGTPTFTINTETIDESCFGCQVNRPNVIIRKKCYHNRCEECKCAPMWCVQCIARILMESDAFEDIMARCPHCRKDFCAENVVKTVEKEGEKNE